MNRPYYLDHHSTTPCLPEVVEAMLPYFSEDFGNPAAITHDHGRSAGKAVERARREIAGLLGVDASEVYFTSGATESNNIALRGADLSSGDHALSSAIEHRSVSAPLEHISRSAGANVQQVTADREGFVEPAAIAAMLTPSTKLVTVMAANGEIGTIEPAAEIAEMCAARGIRFHTDATQAVGKIDTRRVAASATTLSLSAHKFYGPKGIGVLIVRRGTHLRRFFSGGGQERGVRSGTVNVPGVIGMAKALSIVTGEQEREAERLSALRRNFAEKLLSTIPRTFVHGPSELRLPGNLSVSFAGVDAEALMHSLRRFSLSSGAACSSADREPSHVLRAIGVERDLAMSSIRIGMGRSTTSDVLDLLLSDLTESIGRLRELNG